MEEIIKKANELGLMIKGSDLYKRYVDLSKKLEADKEARRLLEEYSEFASGYHEKEEKGGTIEVEEKKKLEDFNERMAKNDLIREFLATNSYYMNLMLLIQQAITEPEGEPISESKIIKPGEKGKIITGI